jgi:hypothetical protein
MEKKLEDLSVMEIKSHIFDLSEQIKQIHASIEILYKRIPDQIKIEQDASQKEATKLKK